MYNMNSKISGRTFEYNSDMMVARSLDTPGIHPTDRDMDPLHCALSTLSLQSTRDYLQVYTVYVHLLMQLLTSEMPFSSAMTRIPLIYLSMMMMMVFKE